MLFRYTLPMPVGNRHDSIPSMLWMWSIFPCFLLGQGGCRGLNASIAWNMKSETDRKVKKCSYRDFQTALYFDMLNFESKRQRDERGFPNSSQQLGSQQSLCDSSLCCLTFSQNLGNHNGCVVCQLEADLRLSKNRSSGPVRLPNKSSRGPKSKQSLGTCVNCDGVFLHGNACAEDLYEIMPMFGSFAEFRGKTCFEIYHLSRCKGLWNTAQVFKKDTVSGSRVFSHTEIHRNQTHEVYIELQSLYGIPNKRKKNITSDNENNNILEI